RLPTVTRITSYGRSKTAAKKSVEEYRVLREAGLSRIHIGLESGGDRILAFMNKGVTAADHIEGGKRIVESGISLSEYIMPGLGGSRWTEENARETARVINAINPDFVRIRSLQVAPGTALSRFVEEKRFEMLSDDGVVKEIRLFIECLDGVESTIVSDHILNLLEEVEGTMPADREKMYAVIDRYLALPEVDREVFRLGRRRGMFSRLDDLHDDSTRGTLRRVVDTYRENDPGGLERDLRRIMEHYI
ncbi:MAG: radical SAM protein, partial [Deltaproteobacteria bacterium]|nr:radical SAM protein [Deltaproteobacteria bacterium]